MSILYVGIDLAKNVFAVHGVNEAGSAELRQPRVARAKLHALIAALPRARARAVLNAATNKTDSLSRWAVQLRQRRGYWKAVVAIAAKNARMAWAVLTKGESFVLPT